MWHTEHEYMLPMLRQQKVLNDEVVVSTLNAKHRIMHMKSIMA